jgi:polyferredoxin
VKLAQSLYNPRYCEQVAVLLMQPAALVKQVVKYPLQSVSVFKVFAALSHVLSMQGVDADAELIFVQEAVKASQVAVFPEN